ncbi:MAG: RodZ domain-containing protein [bacterium]
MIGITLREKRKEKKIPLKKISEATKIRVKYLEALEEENYEIFPAEVYLKGFLRSYANYLELNGNELVQVYEQEHPQQNIKPELNLRTTKVTVPLRPKKRNRKTALVFISTLAVIVTLLIPAKIFYYSTLPIQWYIGKNSKDIKNGPVVMSLEARVKQVTWMRVIADGVKIEERNFYPAELKTWQAKDKFELKIGNVYGLDLRLDDKWIDIISPSKDSVLDIKLDRGAVGDTTQ